MADVQRRLFRLALGYPTFLSLLSFASLIGAVAVILQMFNLSGIIDGAFLGHLGLAELRIPFLWLAGAVCLRASTLWLSEFAAQEIAIQIKERLRNRLFRRLVKRGPLFTEREKTGELATCNVEGPEKLDAWYASFLPHGLAMAIVPVTLALFVFCIDWPSGIVLMLTGPLIPLFMALIGVSAKHKVQRQWSALSRMSGHFLDVLQGLPTLHLLGRSSVQAANILRVSEQFRRTTMQVLLVAFLSGLVLELAASISTAILAVEIGIRLIEGVIDFRTGLFILLLAPEFYLPFRLFGASHHAGMEGAAAAKRIFELLDIPVNGESAGSSVNSDRANRAAIENAATSANIPGSRTTIVPGDRSFSSAHGMYIRFRDVGYCYPGADFPAVQSLSFALSPGRIYVLTGHSGAGKTTVMKLLLRLVEPTAGALLVNEQPLTGIRPEIWRRQVAFVSQHPHFFEGSVLENLRIAAPQVSRDEVRGAARLAEADDFILALPQGYDTPISEAALRFSGGERQRLAIARALLKDCPLVLLDEPVSHLDEETARKLQGAFRRLAWKRTILIIAHHGFAYTDADDLFVLSRGRLVGSSTNPINSEETGAELVNLEGCLL